MKKLLFLFLFIAFLATHGNAQCPTTSQPTSNCASNYEVIPYFALNNVVIGTNTTCSPNGYGLFSSPVLTLSLGSSYTWTIFTANVYSVTNTNSLAFWIDFNNDGYYSSNEQAVYGVNTTPQLVGNINYYGYAGSLTIPSNAVTGANLSMRVRSHSGSYPHNDPCTSYPTGALNGETQDYFIYINCPSGNIMTSVSKPTICSGDSTNLSVSGGVTYTWQPGNLIGSNIYVSPSTTTDYTVTATSSQGCTAPPVTVRIYVDPSPTLTVIQGATSICTGESATLSVSGASGYVWQPGTMIGSSIVVNPLYTTSYSVTGTTGNCSAQAALNVTVNPIPSVTASTGTAVICYGTAASFNASGADTYTWQPGGYTGSSISPTLTSGGNFTVTGEANGCENTAITSITVNPGASFTYTTNLFVLTVYNTSPPSLSSFTWNFGDQTVSNQFQPGNHNYTSAGTYSVRLDAVSPAPCPNVHTSFVLRIPSQLAGGTGIKEQTADANLISVYPNPVRTTLQVHNAGITNLLPLLEIYTISGSLVKTINNVNLDAGDATIDVSELPAGTYFLKLHSIEHQFIKLFVRE